MMFIETQQGTAVVQQIAFIQGDEPIVCHVDSAPQGVSINTQRQLIIPASLTAGTYSFGVVCENCGGVGVSALTVNLRVVASTPVPVPTPTPAPTPVPVPTPTPTVPTNSVALMLADMQGNNDIDWQGLALSGGSRPAWANNPNPAVISMSEPRGSSAPDWYKNSADPSFIDGSYWTGVSGWTIISNDSSHSAQNAAIETALYKIEYISKSTGQWTLLRQTPGGIYYKFTKNPFAQAITSAQSRVGPNSSIIARYPTGENNIIHGEWEMSGGNPKIDISGIVADIGAVRIQSLSRLVKWDDNGVDDLDSAVLGLQTGLDWVKSISQGQNINPGSGLSRTKRLTRNWQWFNYFTFSGARLDTTTIPGGLISAAQLQSNPPTF